MKKTLTFAYGTSKKDLSSSCFSVISFDHQTGDQSVIGFRKGKNIKQLFTDFILPFDKHDSEIRLMFKSARVAKSFQDKNKDILPTLYQVKSLEGLNKLGLENSQFDEVALHSVLLELLGSQILDISALSQSQQGILEDLMSDINDSLTQSLLVGIAKPPLIYNMGNSCGK